VLTSLDSVLALGVTPIATADPIDPYLGDRAEGIEFIGQGGAPNLERIVALQPDLVLGIDYPANLYGPLSQIAPTVLAKFETSGEWKQVLATYAAALGREAEAAEVMAAYKDRLQDFQTRMGDALATTEVSIVRVRPDAIDIYPEDSFCGTVVADAGLPRPAAQTQMSWLRGLGRSAQQAGRISKERLDLADGDVMFVWTYGSHADLAQQAQTALERLQADPLWAQLQAVQQGRVYEVPDYWIGLGPLAAQAVIDDLFTYLLLDS
jgi:iron complex transport system substrate-binding protein